MQIFDQFPDTEKAELFAAAAREVYGLEAVVYDNVEKANAADPFPFPLVAPVVHVARADGRTERFLQRAVEKFDGIYAGT